MITNESKKSLEYLESLIGKKPTFGDHLLLFGRAAEFAEKLGYSGKQFVRLCLQDMLNREGLSLIVDIENAA